MPASNIPKYLYVSFSRSVLITAWFWSSTPTIMRRFAIFIISMAHFPMPNSIPISWQYILTVFTRVSNSFLFLANSLISSMYIKWLIFSCYLLSLYVSVHFLRICLKGLMAITNSNGDSASPWNTPLCIFTFANLFPPAVNSTLQVSMVFSKLYDLIGYFIPFWDSLVSILGRRYRKPFCCQSRP